MKHGKNIVLIGFMGCGKSTVGRLLSARLGLDVEDTDELIERQAGKSISRIFAEDGEEFFRRMETALLEEIRKDGKSRILSVGGGTPVRPGNRKLLGECGTVVWLRVTPKTVWERLKGDTGRPLLQCADPLSRIRELIDARKEAYEACTDLIIDVDGRSLEEIVEELTARIR